MEDRVTEGWKENWAVPKKMFLKNTNFLDLKHSQCFQKMWKTFSKECIRERDNGEKEKSMRKVWVKTGAARVQGRERHRTCDHFPPRRLGLGVRQGQAGKTVCAVTDEVRWKCRCVSFQAQALRDWHLPRPVSWNTWLWNPAKTLRGNPNSPWKHLHRKEPRTLTNSAS